MYARAIWQDQWGAIKDSVWLQLPCLLYLHTVLHEWVYYLPLREVDSYRAPSIVLEALRSPQILLLFLIAGTIVIGSWRSLAWQRWDHGRLARNFMIVPVAIFAVTFSTYDINAYFGQTHTFDRLLLVGLGIGVWFRPTFILPFVLVLSLILGQLAVPLTGGHWHWPDKRLPYDVLVLFSAFCVTSLVFGAKRRTLLLGILVLTALTYGIAAINKMNIGPEWHTWMLKNELSDIFFGAHTNGGWLRDYDPTAYGRFLGSIERVLSITTMAVELSALLLLLARRLTIVILISLAGMHLGILLSTGIFFWKWILLDLALAWFVYRNGKQTNAMCSWRAPVVKRSHGLGLTVLTIYLVLYSRSAFSLIPFAWWDTPVSNFYEIEAIGASGKRYPVNPRFFAPYDVIFQQSRFHYIHEGRTLVGTYGVSHNWYRRKAISRASIESAQELRDKIGRSRYWESEAFNFRRFVKRFVENAQRRGTRQTWASFLAPPYHFQTTPKKGSYAFQESIERIEIYYEEWFSHTGTPRRVKRKLVMTIPID